MCNLIYAILNIIGFIFIYKYIKIFINKPAKNKKIEILSCISGYFISTLTYIFIDVPLVNLFTNVIGIFLIINNYDINLGLKYSCTVLVSCIISLSKIITYQLYGMPILNMLLENKQEKIIFQLTNQVMLFLIYILIKFFTSVQKKIAINLYVILVFTLCMVFNIMVFTEGNNKIPFSVTIVLYIVIISIYIYVTTIEYNNEKFKISIIKKQNKYYKQQLDTINRLNKVSKSVKHDYKNHISIIKSLLDDEKFLELKEYVDDILGKINHIEKINFTQNIIIDSILNFKIDEIKENNIKYDFNIKIPNDFNINSVDITIILSNLLDNAIEACSIDLKNIDKYILLDLIFKDNLLIIKCKNSFDGVINKKDKYIISRKNNKLESGIGIYNIQNVVKKYNGLMDIEYNEKDFNVDISLIIP
ncbi:GHKL domain-containing protein [uncultured Tyzzerella sp.]|uniref:sensor histidine kinase n=1 Tax=uncultured Tyzzerella sp. TaxID=2321398 RepID=UPI002942EFC1|nr:GHKL domain-containing protein [uncultured Tyzzerella sp.]